ncbi:MAG: hypothetical protein HQK50_07875 [Oligoflexia bacterium]|nr:hypothetical protein [Oligoflexia bacterium]MBF0365475.1 hypothetical protein [Oligoflexia bacterium]
MKSIYNTIVWVSFVALFAIFCLPKAAKSDVDPRSGNFNLTYSDIRLSGKESDLEISRTYNSQTLHVGWFGAGWGCVFETRVIALGDGSLIVRESGSGQDTRYLPLTGSVSAEGATKKILEGIKQKVKLEDKVEKGLRERFIGDLRLRQLYEEAMALGKEIAVGAIFYESRGGRKVSVERTKEGYLRTFPHGRKEYFALDGSLRKITEASGYEVKVNYAGKVVKDIKDNDDKILVFEWNSDHKVIAVSNGGNSRAVYAYEDIRLTKATNTLKQSFEYTYDSNNLLLKVLHKDKTTIEIDYDKQRFYVTKYKDRSGNVVSYKYGRSKKNPETAYWTEALREDFWGKPQTIRYEYEEKKRADGSSYDYRNAVVEKGVLREIIYDEKSGHPLKLISGKYVSNFKYNEDGLLLERVSNRGEFIRYQYDKRVRKVAKVENNFGSASYNYDQRGNLVSASTDHGLKLNLFYNSKGMVSKVVHENWQEKNRHSMEFEYNIMGKPSKIVVEHLGTLELEYDNLGRVKAMKSPKGDAFINEIVAVIRAVVDTVAPVGINIGL